MKWKFKAKMDLFLSFTLNNLLVRTLPYAKTLIWYFFAYENMKKAPKSAESFNSAKSSHSFLNKF